MKKIIVTGCNGQLGRAINACYAESTEYELVNTDVEDLDITDVDAVLASAAVKARAMSCSSAGKASTSRPGTWHRG